jgi:hypothetical protein
MRTHNFSNHLVLERALWISVAIMDMSHLLWSMVKSEAENNVEAKLRTNNGGSSLCSDKELGDLWLVAAASIGGGDNTWEVQSPTLQDKNPRSGLNWFCLVMTLLNVLFCEDGLSLWEPMIYGRVMTALVHYFFWKRRYRRRWTSNVVLVVFYCYTE